MLGGTVATIVLTNLIPAAIANGPCGYTANQSTYILEPVVAMANGDITGDLVVTADIYNKLDASGCMVVYGEEDGTDTGMPTKSQQVVKIYQNITVHPGLTVTFQVPVMAGYGAVPGAEFMIKAALYLPGTVQQSGGLLAPTQFVPGYYMVSVPWMPGYFTTSSGGTTPTKTAPTGSDYITHVFGP
jgi:hypothetical protein